MNARAPWLVPAVLVAAVYTAIGITFALPAGNLRFWRLAAWLVSGFVYGVHLMYERFQLRHSVPAAALHVAVGAALGAFGLAVGANVHSLSVASTPRQHQLLLIALVAWPVITGIPAFLVALATGGMLGKVSPQERN